MSILYKAQAKKNPRTGAVKYYAQATGRRLVGFESLAKEIEKSTSLTAGDALNMLRTMQYLVVQHLLDNDSVKFDNLGTFSLELSSNPSDTADEVAADNIKGLRVCFRASRYALGNTRSTKAVYQDDVQFEKVSDADGDDNSDE